MRTGHPPGGASGRKKSRAIDLLTKYKQGKAMLESAWWRTNCGGSCATGRSCGGTGQKGEDTDARPEPTRVAVQQHTNKHADAMDNYPEPVVLPREQSDEESAKVLSSVLPVVLEYNDYEQTYSDNWWEN